MSKEENPNTKPTKPKTRRGWKDWQGHNTILFNGRVIGGPEKSKTIRTLVLVGVPSILFSAGVGNKFWATDEKYVTIVNIILAVLSIVTLFKTAFTDPGIIPRKPGASRSRESRSHPPRYQDLCINGRTVRLKYCQTCLIFRPPRSFHCPICENCVERFDHHCPWIGTCIGLRNYGWFTSFIWLTTTLCLFVLGHSIKLLVRTGNNWGDANPGESTWNRFKHACSEDPIAIILVVYVFLSMWFVTGLCAFHTYLVAKNKTTNEQLRNFYKNGSPYSLGFLRNISQMCCKFPESSVHIHHKEPIPTEQEEEIQKQMVVYVDSLAKTGGAVTSGGHPADPSIVQAEEVTLENSPRLQPLQGGDEKAPEKRRPSADLQDGRSPDRSRKRALERRKEFTQLCPQDL